LWRKKSHNQKSSAQTMNNLSRRMMFVDSINHIYMTGRYEDENMIGRSNALLIIGKKTGT